MSIYLLFLDLFVEQISSTQSVSSVQCSITVVSNVLEEDKEEEHDVSNYSR